MVDRKLYSRSRQKRLLNRVVDEELYRPDDELVDGRRSDRGIAGLLQRGAATPHHRHRLSELVGPAAAGPATGPGDAPALRPRPSRLRRLAGGWRRLVALLAWR